MPLYEYKCDACGHRFERIRKFSDPPINVCPNCSERKVHKLLSSPAIKFKGSGFYITDYARKGEPVSEAAKADGSAKTDEKSSASAKDGSSTSKTTESSSSATDAAPATPVSSPTKNS
jgi:putative FmdB family regulatory protein